MLSRSVTWKGSSIMLGTLLLLAVRLAAAPAAQGQLEQARAAFQRGQVAEALTHATQAVETEPKNAQAWFVRGQLHEQQRQFEKAVADFTKVIELNPKISSAFQARGGAQFRLGRIKESLADFDQAVALAPQSEPHNWQRGISQYYAGQFEAGRRQFELHQQVNSQDVENAVWHFLCHARTAGEEKARAALLPIQFDRRVPMMQIYALFQGKGSAEEVMKAARAGTPSPEELRQRLFYAHLYLGLHAEAHGDAAATREHMQKAARDFQTDHYMGDVARVHAALLEKKK